MTTLTDDRLHARDFCTLVELLQYRASVQRDRLVYAFLADGDTAAATLTYGELDRRARAVGGLIQQHVESGARVLLCYPPGLDFIAGLFGCLYAGVVAVPAYPPRPNRPTGTLEAIATRAQASAVLTTASVPGHGREHSSRDSSFDQLRRLLTDSLTDRDAECWRPATADGDSLAALQFTSGSTSAPKGVMLTHRNLLANSAIIERCFGHSPDSRGVIWLPPYHDMGLIGGVLQPLFAGFPVTLMAPGSFLQHPARWLQTIARERATTSGGPNFAYRLCVEKITPEERRELDLSSWTVAFNGAEPIDAVVLDRFAEAFAPCGFRREAFYPCYGLAEATLLVTGGERAAAPLVRGFSRSALERNSAEQVAANIEDARLLVGCGQAQDARVAIVDPESAQEVAAGGIGEIWIAGAAVAAGYWDMLEETERTFGARLAGADDGPFLRTGDLGTLVDGELYVTGRIKDLLIVNGRNHYPHDIEASTQRAHPALSQQLGAAFMVEADGADRLVVVHEVKRSALRGLDAKAVIDAVLAAVSAEHELAVHAIALVRPGAIPRTSSGKIQRNATRERFQSGGLDPVALWPDAAAMATRPTVQTAVTVRAGSSPATAAEIQDWLIQRLAERMGRAASRVDPDQPFYHFGIGSVEAVGIAADLGTWLGRSLPATLAWDYPSVRALAAHLAEGDAPVAQSAQNRAVPATADAFVAIVGLGCRFPAAPEPAAFWDLLRSGRDGVGRVPADRWSEDAAEGDDNLHRIGGFLDRVDAFDADFFGIAPREVQHMDPQQRLLLEVAWEALENSNIAAEDLRGSRTGVFVGISTLDYSHLLAGQGSDRLQAYTATGTAASIAANRISYLLDLRGPSFAVDTACSSSLVAVHLACRGLLDNECDVALAGGVNLILSPELTRSLAKAQMMSKSGRCRTFDAAADGYVRGEGCGVIVMKRLADARAAGDDILAIVRGSAVNQDGRSNGLTAPNGPAQQAVIRDALAHAHVTPAQIGYVEAHGTGTPLGDPIEIDALKAVLLDGRNPGQACGIGSVKTNVGHLEAAAGIAGLIKTVLALRHEAIPPNLHLTRLNPNISLADTPLFISDAARPWPRSVRERFAGVSSFGFGGTNCHVVLQEGPPTDAAALSATPLHTIERPRHVLAVSARSAPALRELANRYAQAPQLSNARVADFAYTAQTSRSHFPHRLALSGVSADELRERLAGFASGEVDAAEPELRDCEPRIAFLFTGQGSQYSGMGRQLYNTQPVFRAALDRCSEILASRLERPLLSILYLDASDENRLDRTAHTQPALFALEYALCELWRSWGVVPAALLGHSVGEYAAACIAGVYSLEDGLALIAERGRLMQELAAGGEMAVVWADESRVAEVLTRYPGVTIAALNGPANTVVSGEGGAVRAVLRELEREGIGGRALNVSHAFHSPLMAPVEDALERLASGMSFAQPVIPLVSNLTGQTFARGEAPSAQYWRRHLREPVRFADGMRELHARGCDLLVEIGPNPTLLAMGLRCLPDGAATGLASLRRGQDDWQVLLDSVSTLYTRGMKIDWTGFDRPYRRHRVALPNYPFQRQRYWIETAPERRRVHGPAAHPLLGERLPALAHSPHQHAWEVDLAAERLSFLQEHRVHGAAVMPVSGYLEIGLAAARQVEEQPGSVLADLDLKSMLVLSEDRPRTGQTILSVDRAGTGSLSVYSRPAVLEDRVADPWTLHATAKVVGAGDSAIGRRRAAGSLGFGLMFFASGEDAESGDKYRLVIDSARYADAHGFESVWVPERHFSQWGCLYPNPSVLHAALARETRRLRLRAGSVVLPLHNALRVAEEWSVVDNLSGGRVDLSFASGWNPADFALAPERYANRHEEVFAGIETVKRLWRGESIEVRSGDGSPIQVRTYPTPVQREVGVWVTAAGNPRTFERAGEIGANVLTHLLDQGVDEVAHKIGLYRKARERAGFDPASGHVSIMLHTFVGADVEQVREQVRKPFCDYLKTLKPLLKSLAQSRGRSIDIDALSAADLDEFVDFLYQRFFSTRALLGTPESCRGLIEQLAGAGVNEVACLLDFGPATQLILDNLPQLNRLRELCESIGAQPPASAQTAVLMSEARAEDLEHVRARCDKPISPEQLYARLERHGVHYQGSFRAIQQLWVGSDEALGAIAWPEANDHKNTDGHKNNGNGNATKSNGNGHKSNGNGALQLHPGLLDACFQVFVAAALNGSQDNAQSEHLYLPKGVERFQMLGAAHGPLWSHARLERSEAQARVLRGEIRIWDAGGSLIAQASGFKLERAAALSTARPAGLDDWLYELRWEPVALNPAHAQPGRWLVLAERGTNTERTSIGEHLAQRLRESGASCQCLYAEELGQDPAGESLRTRLREWLSQGNPATTNHIVHLWALDSAPLTQASSASLQAEQRIGADAMLSVIQTLATEAPGTPLWVITRAAQAVSGESALALSQSPLWGLGRTCAMEHPEVWGGLIDLDPNTTPAESASQLLDVLQGAAGEDQNALRAGQRYVARLVHAQDSASANTNRPALTIHAQASYLITGGLWGLGFEVARWLAQQGARELLLIGRSALPPKEQWGELEPHSRAARQVAGLLELEQRGVNVRYAQLDVADQAALSTWWQQQQAQGVAPLKGIIHAASVWQDQAGRTLVRPLLGLDRAAMHEVFAPKVNGSFALERVLGQSELDFFVCFSSGASLVGSVAQGNYAAASAFLDALAQHRRLQGRAGLSINWGAVSQAGFGATAEGKRVHEYWEAHGIGRIDPVHVTQALERFIPSERAQIGVMRNDWPLLAKSYPRLASLPLARYLVAAQAAKPGSSKFRRKLNATSAKQRRALLLVEVRDEVARVMGLNASAVELRRGLFDMGMDSLMALELRTRLQASLELEIPATVAFEFPTIEAIAGYLGDKLSLEGAGGTVVEMPKRERSERQSDALEKVLQLSDEDVERQLEQRLRERKSGP